MRLNPAPADTRCTLRWLTPTALAILRALQCVALAFGCRLLDDGELLLRRQRCDAGADYRNALLSRKPAPFVPKPPENQQAYPDALYGNATWSHKEITSLLDLLTLPRDTPLSCLAVETLPGGSPFPDPLGMDLGLERLLRTSPLVPVPAICGN
jgi:hypothetical protein